MSEDIPSPDRLTSLVAAWGHGDTEALDALIPLVHGELKRLARRQMARERSNHTLQPTALVNEAYLRLSRESRADCTTGAQFYGIAARLMRFILVDYARARQMQRRGGKVQHVEIDAGFDVAGKREDDVLAIDEALAELARLDERKAKVAELRIFAGLTADESSRVLGVSPATVTREWRFARAWLQRQLRS